MTSGEVHKQKKHYRQPRRRPAHLRTKTGCLTCRKRKKKCDETPNVCKNCFRGNHACVWPGSGRGSTRRRSDEELPDQRTSSGKSPSSAISDQLISSTATDDHHVSFQNTTMIANNAPFPCIYTPSPFTPYSIIIPPESIPLFHFLSTSFLPSLIHPMAQQTTIEFVKQEKLQTAFSTPFLMHALLACCGAEFPADDTRYRRIAERHYAKAIAGLRDYLAGATELGTRSIVLLMTVIVLCIYERSKPRLSRGVDVHLLGAAQLIQLHLKQDKASISSASDTTMLHLMLEAFIFHATTSIPFQQPLVQSAAIDSAFPLAERRLEEMNFRTETCLYASSPIIGVPPKLFGYIREIALMHQRFTADGVDTLRCYELECILDEWDSDIGTRTAVLPQDPQHLGSTRETVLSLGPKLYILASRILLRHMRNSVSSPTSIDPSAITALVSYGVSVISQLQPSTDYYAEYYCWPILVVGKSTVDQFERECLLSQAMAFWKATRNGTMRRLVDILRGYWGEHGRCWVQLDREC